MNNILTFDVEDWYHGFDLPPAQWTEFERRLSVGMDFILDCLARTATQATFFVLGQAALDHPGWVRQIAGAGHEIGTHGWSHTPIYRQTPAEFRRELRSSLYLLQSLSDQPIRGHRAAFFSITQRSLWALDELAAAGIRYDSSIFPVHNYRYGIPDAPRFPYPLARLPLWELPISTLALGQLNVPFSGGFYIRFWPYAWVRWAIRHLNRQGRPVIVYFHPWEFDDRHPQWETHQGRLARLTHYHRLSCTRQRLRALLADFQWTSMGDWVEALEMREPQPVPLAV